ncbi:MAG: hypothetical protein EXQ52_06415 [Bryobacterales bacterium]|nr:hypothetical protein [Bryobacterales bacterium]
MRFVTWTSGFRFIVTAGRDNSPTGANRDRSDFPGGQPNPGKAASGPRRLSGAGGLQSHENAIERDDFKHGMLKTRQFLGGRRRQARIQARIQPPPGSRWGEVMGASLAHFARAKAHDFSTAG